MANRWVAPAAGLVGGQVAGRGLSALLDSRSGEQLLTKLDHNTLTPLEHRVLVQRWSGNIGKALSIAAATLATIWSGYNSADARARRVQMGNRNVDWVQVMQRTAEVMLAIGAIFKVVGEFLEDRQKTAHETERAAARRLA
jgi:hypothetical protein